MSTAMMQRLEAMLRATELAESEGEFLKDLIDQRVRTRYESEVPSVIPIPMFEATPTSGYAKDLVMQIQRIARRRGHITRTSSWVEEAWSDGTRRMWPSLQFQVGWDNGDVYQFSFAPGAMNCDLKIVIIPERYYLDLRRLEKPTDPDEPMSSLVTIRHEAPEAKLGGDAE